MKRLLPLLTLIAMMHLVSAGALAQITITTPPQLPDGAVGVPYSLQMQLTETGATPPYHWTVAVVGSPLPPGLVLTDGGLITGTPTTPGSWSEIEIMVGDSATSAVPLVASKWFNLNINILPLTILTTSPLPEATVGLNYAFSFEASGGVPPYNWTLINGTLPPGFTLTLGGLLTGTPDQTGTWRFELRVQDSPQNGTPQSVLAAFSITITPFLRITSPSPLPRGTVGLDYTFGFEAFGGVPPYTWKVTLGSLPPGLGLSSDGTLTGVPSKAGAYQFTVSAWDSASGAATHAYTMFVIVPLTITTLTPLPPGNRGLAYTTTLAAEGGVPPYNWLVVEGRLPPGLTLSATGLISGVPTETGVYRFQARVVDTIQASQNRLYSITIHSNFRVTTSSPLPDATVGTPYSQLLALSGGTAPFTWSIVEGALPSGLALGPNGEITGTPTATGTFMVQIRVVDATKDTAGKVFDLTVNAAPLTIVTSSLPGGEVGTAYSAPLEASGGEQPYSWTVAAGSLPDGLTLDSNGTIAGTPTAAGAVSFWVEVTDSVGTTVTRELALAITPPPLLGAAINGLPGQVNPAQQQPFTVNLTERYPLALTGKVTLTFEPDAVVPVDDPAVQLTTGGRSADFTIPAGETAASFSLPKIAVQTGSVAGRITVTLQLFAGTQDVTPAPQPVQEIQIVRAAPVISSVRLVRTSGGFEVHVVGLSTPREVTQADFTFTPATGTNLQTTHLTVSLGSAFTTWYQNDASAAFGSMFEYVQPFTISGNANAVASVTVTLTNGEGASSPVSAGF